MQKAIKKEIERNLYNPSDEYAEIIKAYTEEIAGTEKAVVLRCFFTKRQGYRAVVRELNRNGFYLEQTTFYRIKDDIIIDIALRACYEGIICPYSVDTKQ